MKRYDTKSPICFEQIDRVFNKLLKNLQLVVHRYPQRLKSPRRRVDLVLRSTADRLFDQIGEVLCTFDRSSAHSSLDDPARDPPRFAFLTVSIYKVRQIFLVERCEKLSSGLSIRL